MPLSPFEIAYCRYAEAHIDRILSFAEKSPPRLERFLQNTFRDSSYTRSTLETPQYFLLPPNIQDSDYPTDLASECVKIGLSEKILPVPAVSDRDGNPIPNPSFDQIKWHEFGELRWPIVQAFERCGLRHLNKREIVRALKPYLQAWKARAFPIITFSPLRNLEGQFDKIHLHNGVSIERVSDDQRNDLWNPYLMEQTIPIRYFASSPYFIFAKHTQPPPGGTPTFAPSIIEDTITALRLLKQGDVGIDGLLSKPILRGNFGGSFSPQPNLQLDFVFPGHSYELERQDICRLHRLIHLITSLPDDRKADFQIPLARFNRIYSRRQGDDAIIDLAICLESLLLRGISQELSYRFAMRGAALLSKVAPRQHTFGVLQEFYQLRSQVVHGGEHVFSAKVEQRIARRFPGVNVNKFNEEVTELARRIIAEMLLRAAMGMSIQSICDNLDKEVLR